MNKTIKVTLYFFTNNLPEKFKDKAVAWSNGNIQVRADKKRGLTKLDKSIMFNSLEEILPQVKKALSKAKVKLL